MTRRWVMWLVMGSLPAVLLVAGFCLLPFEVQETWINRRTAIETYRVVVYGFYKEQGVLKDHNPGLDKYGSLTAPDIYYMRHTLTKRFPWSKQVGQKVEYGDSLSWLYWNMFGFRGKEAQLRGMGEEQVSHLMKERVSLWNSRRVDEDPKAVNEEVKRENETVLPAIKRTKPPSATK